MTGGLIGFLGFSVVPVGLDEGSEAPSVDRVIVKD